MFIAESTTLKAVEFPFGWDFDYGKKRQ